MTTKTTWLFVALILISQTSFGQTSISLSPTEVFLKGTPGSTVSVEFSVINDGSTPYALTCLFNDVWFDGETTVSGDLGTIKEHQAGYNFQCSPNKVLVPPKFAQKIKAIGVIPKDQTGESYTRFYAQMLPSDSLTDGKENQGLKRATIGYSAKVGALVGVMAEGAQKLDTTVVESKVENSKNFSTLKFKLKNLGNVHVSGVGNLVLTDSNDKVIDKTDAKVPFLCPGQTKSLTVNLSDPLKPGTHKALLSIRGGPNEPSFVKDFTVNVK